MFNLQEKATAIEIDELLTSIDHNSMYILLMKLDSSVAADNFQHVK